MSFLYPLKKSEPANIVQPLIKYLQINQSPQLAMSMRQPLSQINQLRNKATVLELPTEPSIQMIDKFISVIEMYIRYAKLIAKHFNWNSEYGNTVQDCNIVWYDSFNPQLKFMKSQIHFDIFCCYYNLGVMYFYKAVSTCFEELITVRKQSMLAGKRAAFFFNQMRVVFYPGFVNTGFSDTNYPHLQLLECLSIGIIYKNMFNLFKQDQYKHGIHKIASLAVLAKDNFYKSYEIATQFFMKSSNINNNLKSELLSFAYVESLYHDVVANTKYAKYHDNQMDSNKDNVVLLIAYQRKALRLLNLGLSNQNVTHLLDKRPQEKKYLQLLKPDLESSLHHNEQRNKQIYQRKEITEEQIPTPKDPPKEYIVKLSEPSQIAIEYESKNSVPFTKLMDNDSKAFINELKQFSQNRMNGLQSAYAKLQKNIQTIYNDCYVNYYLNLQSTNKDKGVPENLRKKLAQIEANGGKPKIQLEIGIIRKSQSISQNCFQDLRKMLQQEANFDNQKRNQYGNQWKRPPSNIANKGMINQLQIYEKKSSQAHQVNQKLLEKYENLQKFIIISGSSEAQIKAFLPKVEVTKFMEENKKNFDELKSGTADVKNKMQGLDAITDDLRKFFSKIQYTELAQKYYKESHTDKEAVFDKVFGPAYKMIENFNEKAKKAEQNAKRTGQISSELNNKNRGGDEGAKKQFEVIMGKFNDVNNLFRELAQGTSFYTKLNDILAKMDNQFEGFTNARRIEAQQLQNMLGGGRGGGGGNPNLPNMYPNQQPQQGLGFYVPPPMNFEGQSMHQNPSNSNNSSMGDMLHNLLSSKPNFNAQIFGGNDKIYQSRYK